MDESALPDLRQIQQRLAADNARIDAAVDCMFQGMRRLVEASLTDDWTEVEQIAKHLAQTCAVKGQREIAIHARQLYELVSAGSASPESIRLGVARLIADYRRQGMREV